MYEMNIDQGGRGSLGDMSQRKWKEKDLRVNIIINMHKRIYY